MTDPGRIVILNGAPRSGKSSIAAALTASESNWVNIGVDATMAATQPDCLPGIGLRPGGERPDLEPFIADSYRELFAAVARHCRLGADVAVDVGLHRDYATDLDPWKLVEHHVGQFDPLLVGVRCPLDEIMRRRDRDPTRYATTDRDGIIPEPVRRWQHAVHQPGLYDLELDTSQATARDCADVIVARLADDAPPMALAQLTNGG